MAELMYWIALDYTSLRNIHCTLKCLETKGSNVEKF